MVNKNALDPRVRRTRKLLQDALIELLHKRPISKIQIKEIAQQAGMSRHAFYSNFETKEDLLLSYCDDVIFPIQREVFEKAIAADYLDLEEINIAMFSHWEEHRDVLRWVMEMDNNSLFLNRLRGYVEPIVHIMEQIQTDTINDNQMQHFLVEYITGGIYMLLRYWVYEGKHLTHLDIGKVAYRLTSGSAGSIVQLVYPSDKDKND
ncbi:MAG: TetR/AcrR family transcriptional regulator [Chloroflexota bacterium]